MLDHLTICLDEKCSLLTDIMPLTLFILMDYPIHIDTISMELSILYFKGSHVKISIKCCMSVPEDCFYLGKQCRPGSNATFCSISSGSSLFAKVTIYGYPERKGLRFRGK